MYVLPPEDCNTREEPRWRQLCNTVYPIEGMSGEPITTCNPEMYYVTVALSCLETGGPGTYTPPGTGGTTPTDPPTDPDSLKNPCDQAAKLSQNVKFKQLMAYLKAKTTENKEHGYYYKNNAASSPENETTIVGSPNKDYIKLTVSGKIDGIIHSHYAGLYSIFSPSDLETLAILYKAGNMVNPKTFTIGVVTNAGSQYLLKIDMSLNFIFSQII